MIVMMICFFFSFRTSTATLEQWDTALSQLQNKCVFFTAYLNIFYHIKLFESMDHTEPKYQA